MKLTLPRTLFFAALLGGMLSGCGAKTLQVSGAWARPAAAGDNSAVYFSIDNPGEQAEMLVSAACDAADQTEIHMSMMDANGVMVMEPQSNVAVAAQSKVAFEPGGLHVMLVGLKKELKVGDKLTLTLNFDHAGAVTVSAEVKSQ